MSVGENIRNLRRQRRMSQQELALAMNTSQSWISGVESDRGNPRIDSLRRVAIALGVPLNRLLREDEF